MWNGTMFSDADWPLNAWRGLSAIAEFLVLLYFWAAFKESYCDNSHMATNIRWPKNSNIMKELRIKANYIYHSSSIFRQLLMT